MTIAELKAIIADADDNGEVFIDGASTVEAFIDGDGDLIIT